MVKINRVYTRTGDKGTTRLADGTEVTKADPHIEAYGTVDELSSNLGVARSLLHQFAGDHSEAFQGLDTELVAIQQDLFDLGSLLATPVDSELQLPCITKQHVDALERLIDGLNDSLVPPKSFVLPGGHPAAAAMHVARTVCRRAERLCIDLEGVHGEERSIFIYLNRLSDYLFVASRWINHVSEFEEPCWQPGGGTLADS